MNDIYRVTNPFYFITFFIDSFFCRKMGGEFWEHYLTLALSYPSRWILYFFIIFVFYFSFFLWVILLFGIEEMIKGLG